MQYSRMSRIQHHPNRHAETREGEGDRRMDNVFDLLKFAAAPENRRLSPGRPQAIAAAGHARSPELSPDRRSAGEPPIHATLAAASLRHVRRPAPAPAP